MLGVTSAVAVPVPSPDPCASTGSASSAKVLAYEKCRFDRIESEIPGGQTVTATTTVTVTAAPTDPPVTTTPSTMASTEAATSTPPPMPAGCALPNYPTPSCIGVPTGTVFTTTVTGDYDATTAGQVIDGWHIKGFLNILAPGVTVRNTKIDAVVFNQFGTPQTTYPYTISDSTIGPDTGCIRRAGLQSSQFTATRVLIQGVDHGVDFGDPGDVTIQDSFITLCYLDATVTPPDGSHVDGVQTLCGATCTGARFLHNTMVDPTHKGTFVINVMDPLVQDFTARDNLLFGGDNYVITAMWRAGVNFEFTNNRVVNGTWGTAAPASAESTCAHQDWTGNSIVTIDADYTVTGTVAALPCIQ